MTSLCDDVLKVFIDYADRELRAGDVRDVLAERGRTYAGPGNISVACARLHREGRLFRVQEGNAAWYCVARAMR